MLNIKVCVNIYNLGLLLFKSVFFVFDSVLYISRVNHLILNICYFIYKSRVNNF